MMNYAKAQNLRGASQSRYEAVSDALNANRLYRAELWVGGVNDRAGAANHEIVLVTGANDSEVVYFEPNFGFFHPVEDGLNNRQAVEHFIEQQYQASNMKTANFAYHNVRSNSSASPKGFSVA